MTGGVLILQAKELARRLFFAEVGEEDPVRSTRLMALYERARKRYERRCRNWRA